MKIDEITGNKYYEMIQSLAKANDELVTQKIKAKKK